jgi:hypothetical protein
MNFRKLGIFTAIFATAGFFSILAQGQRGPRMYNPSTETTLQGSVTAVNTATGTRGWNGVHLTVQSAEQKYDVHVGPAAYLASQKFAFAEGDQVEVTGSKVDLNGAPTLIAREIRRDGKTLSLRDKQGFPLWSRGPRTAP